MKHRPLKARHRRFSQTISKHSLKSDLSRQISNIEKVLGSFIKFMTVHPQERIISCLSFGVASLNLNRAAQTRGERVVSM